MFLVFFEGKLKQPLVKPMDKQTPPTAAPRFLLDRLSDVFLGSRDSNFRPGATFSVATSTNGIEAQSRDFAEGR